METTEKPKRQRKPRRNHAAELAAIERFVDTLIDTISALHAERPDDYWSAKLAAVRMVKDQLEKNRGAKV